MGQKDGAERGTSVSELIEIWLPVLKESYM